MDYYVGTTVAVVLPTGPYSGSARRFVVGPRIRSYRCMRRITTNFRVRSSPTVPGQLMEPDHAAHPLATFLVLLRCMYLRRSFHLTSDHAPERRPKKMNYM